MSLLRRSPPAKGRWFGLGACESMAVKSATGSQKRLATLLRLCLGAAALGMIVSNTVGSPVQAGELLMVGVSHFRGSFRLLQKICINVREDRSV